MPEADLAAVRRLDLTALPLVARLGQFFARRGYPLYLVGGSVRNALLGAPPGDLDFTTPARPPEVKRLLRQAGAEATFDVGERFGTVGGVFEGVTVEITTYRSETYRRGSRKPEVEFGESLLGDLSRRDFTINAMAADAVTGEVVDPFGGEQDLQAGVIRAVGEPESRFAEDPLRLLRAVRFAAQYGFRIEPATRAAIRRQAGLLPTVSWERIQVELSKILVSPHPASGIRLLCDLGLMAHIIPEVLELRGMHQEGYRHKDVYEHTLQVLENVPPTLVLRLAALLHDIAKPRTRSVDDGEVHFFGHDRKGAQMAREILARLRYSAEIIERVCQLVELHLRANAYEPDWTDGAVRRLMREVGPALDDLLVLSHADVTSRSAERRAAARRRVDELRARVEAIRAREDVAQLKSPLDGHDLMALFSRGPGPWIKPIKEHLLNLVLEGQLRPDDRAAAEAEARRLMEAMEADSRS